MLVSRVFACLFTAALLEAATHNCTTFSVPGSNSSRLSDINNSGISVGAYFVANGVAHGFRLDASGNFTTVGLPEHNQQPVVRHQQQWRRDGSIQLRDCRPNARTLHGGPGR